MPLLLVGASTRAAAGSALRAGFQPICCDQFADLDLQAVAQVVRVGSNPHEFAAATAQFPSVPVVYTGGLENHPDVLARFADERPLWGMSAQTVAAIRNPLLVKEALVAARLPCLDVRSSNDPPPPDGRWLFKPLRSAGGRGIVAWTPAAVRSVTPGRGHYFQRRLAGPSYSAVFIAQGTIGDVRFVGLTEQLVGITEFHAGPFAWCGNIGPATLPVQIESSIRRIANFLKWKFGLRGIFGLDVVVSPDGQVGVTEVNPRYPASLELLEFATGGALLRDHCESFAGPLELPTTAWMPTGGDVLGKAVLYAPAPLKIETDLPVATDSFRQWPSLADLPAAGSVINRGDPVVTVYARGGDAAACRSRLQQAASEAYARLRVAE